MDDANAQALGSELGKRYEVLEKLGAGDSGPLYKARQVATGQTVAIQVLHLGPDVPAEAQEKRLGQFERVMQLCARVRHPNIVRLIDSGRVENGNLYIVFEYTPGKSLAQVLAEEGALEPGEARHLMIQLLDALASAHALGVIHRDLKPTNIRVVLTGARRNALIGDFGIGELTEQSSHEPFVHVSHDSIGTPAYAAPEQLRGLAPTPRSDLYTWALIFLECLTGRRAFEGATLADILFQQLSPEPMTLPPAIANHPLGHLLRRATVKDPEARHVTAEGLLRELEECDLGGLHPRDLSANLQRTALPPQAGTLAPGASLAGVSSQLLGGERRQITAVCCTLSAQALKPGAAGLEEIDQILGIQQEGGVGVALRFGGHVAGALGDAVVFYFGYPTAREDDARKAAQAALTILTEIRARSEAYEAERKLRIDVRIGIHTGLVVARELNGSGMAGLGYVMGPTPKLATRLSLLAAPNTIVLSSDTWRLLRKEFLIESSGIQVTDGGVPLETYVLTDGTPTAAQDDLPLIGRAGEFQVLLGRWSRALAGAGQSILLKGEPGIGKSRLARELGEHIVNERHTWLECRCTPDTLNTSFFPLIDLLEQMLDPAREAEPEDRLERMEALLSRCGFDLTESMPIFGQLLSMTLPPRWRPLDVSPQKQRELTRNAILSLLFELAAREPVALLIEDLHWADPSTLELLGHLASGTASARIFAIFTARPEFSPPWPSTAIAQLQLGRLGRSDMEQMASKLSGGRVLPPEVLETIVRRTDGVPLFVEELVRTMLESGVLKVDGGRYVLASPLSGEAIPASLRDLLLARLDRLGRARQTAQVASAIGREFTFELLRALEILDETAAQEDLDRLIAAELIYRKRRLKTPVYLFKHALIRDAAYDSMLRRSRQQVHARIAKALEEKFPDLVNERPELLAHHHAAAEQKPEAIGYSLRAAKEALKRSAYTEAIAEARRGISWLSGIENERQRKLAEIELNAILAPALMASRGWADQELKDVLDRSRELIDLLEDSPQAIPILWALITFHHARSHRADALTLSERCLSLARKSGDIGNEVAVLPLYAQCLFFSGQHRDAREHLDRAIANYDVEAHRWHATTFGQDSKVYALSLSGLQRWLLGYPDRALAEGVAAVEFARELKDANSLGMALSYLLGVWHYRQQKEPARQAVAALMEVAQRHGLPQWAGLGALFQGWINGDPTAPRQIVAGFHAMGFDVAYPYWASILAECEAAAGNLITAIELLDRCLERAEHDREFYYVPLLHHFKGEFILRRDARATEAAERCFRDAIAVSRAQGVKTPELLATTSLARIQRARGQREEARASLSSIYGWFTEGFDTPALVEAKACLQELGGPSVP